MFLVHHHPIQYSDPIADEPDFSAMTNAGNLLSVLRRHNFDLLIHGHKHSPNFTTLSISSGFPIAILGAGSFSARLDTRWNGLVNNQFHLVKVEGRDDINNCIFGLVESWTYLCGSGWMQSDINNGIVHKSLFGTYIQPNELEKTLSVIIGSAFKSKDTLVWLEFISNNSEYPHFKYLPPDLLTQVMDNLSSKLNFRRFGNQPNEIILVKN